MSVVEKRLFLCFVFHSCVLIGTKTLRVRSLITDHRSLNERFGVEDWEEKGEFIWGES